MRGLSLARIAMAQQLVRGPAPTTNGMAMSTQA